MPSSRSSIENKIRLPTLIPMSVVASNAQEGGRPEGLSVSASAAADISDNNNLTFEIEAISFNAVSSQSDLVDQAINLATEYASICTGTSLSGSFNRDAFRQHYANRLQMFEKKFAQQAAEADAYGFSWPKEVFQRDIEDLAR